MKEVQPWLALCEGPVSAERSLLLNYFSPPTYEALYRSLRNRHFLVFTTTACYLLLKVATILSTSLLHLEDVYVHRDPMGFVLKGEFDAANLQDSAFVDSQPLWTVWAHWQYQSGLPLGSTDRYAFQVFNSDLHKSSYSSTITGTVDLFVPDLECEIAEYSYSNVTYGTSHADSYAYSTNVTVQSSSCTVRSTTGRTYGSFQDDFYPILYTTIGNCSEISADSLDSRRLVFVNTLSGRGTSLAVNASALVCKPQYHIEPAIVTRNLSATSDEVSVIARTPSTSRRQIADLHEWTLGQSVYDMVSAAEAYYMTDMIGVPLEDYWADPFFNVTMTREKVDPTDLIEPQSLYTASRRTFQNLASQFARQYLLVDNGNSTPVRGSLSTIQPRLVVRQVPLRIIQCLLGVMSIVCACFWWIMPQNVWPRSMNTIAALTTVFARSSDTLSFIRGTGLADMKLLADVLAGHKFSTKSLDREDLFQIECVPAPKSTNPHLRNQCTDATKLPRPRWWRPLAFAWWFIATTLVLCLICVAGLEIALQLSRSHNGLATVTLAGAQSYAWTYIPVIVLVTVGTLYNSLDFEIETLQPYRTLAKGKAQATHGLFNNPIARSNPESFYNALRKRQLGVFATTLSVLLAPLLTIVVAGLFTTESRSVLQPVSFEQTTVFDYSYQDANGIGIYKAALDDPDRSHQIYVSPTTDDGLLPSLLYQNNITYPQWTWRDLAFPEIQPSEASVAVANSNATVVLTVPALRGNMNCTTVPMDALNISLADSRVNITFNTGDTNPWADGQPCVYTFTSYGDLEDDAYFGYLRLPDCNNTLAGVYAHNTHNHIDSALGLTCKPFTEVVYTNLTLDFNSLSITEGIDPVELRTEFFSDVGFDSFDLLEANRSLNQQSDGFFQTLTKGQNAFHPASLLDPETLLSASARLYGLYAAHKTNTYFRMPLNDTNFDGDPTINAQVVSTQYRLTQNAVSTRLLQAILMLLFTCGVVAYADLCIDTKWTRRVLPRDPRSIASVAALLADSEVLGLVAEGAEWLSNKEMQKQKVCGNYLFRMGLYNDGMGFKIDVEEAFERQHRPIGEQLEVSATNVDGEDDGLLKPEGRG